MSDCLFCRIVAGKIPAALVYQDAETLAFDDIQPQAPTHVLVIPRRHVASVQDCVAGEGNEDQALLAAMLRACVKVAQLKGLSSDGYRLVTNTGADGGQSVFHLHFHVLGGRAMAWPPG